MTAGLGSHVVLTDDELQVVASRVDVDDFPTVLAVRPRHDRVDDLYAARDHATQSLVTRHLINDGAVAPDLVPLLRALLRPDRELAMRLVTPEGVARVCLVRRGSVCVLARRVRNEFELRSLTNDAGLTEVTRSLVATLPPAAPAEIDPVGAPMQALADCLRTNDRGPQLADRIRALGAESRSAMLLGSALASRVAFAEIVYYSLAGDDDRIARSPSAVGIFYTKRGRIVASPSESPTGQLWTTFKAGTDYTIKQAIVELIGLSAERWEST